MKIEYWPIGIFVKKIRVKQIAKCWLYGAAEQSVIHLYTKCQKWRAKLRALNQNPKALEIQWQKQPEKKWLAELLADRYVVGPVLKFLKDIKVRNRKDKREKNIK